LLMTKSTSLFNAEFIDRILLVYAICITPLVMFSIYRAIDIGWQPAMTLHIMILAATYFVAINKTIVPKTVRLFFIPSCLLIAAVICLVDYGLVGPGIPLMIFGVIYLSLVVNYKACIAIALSSVIATLIVALLTINNRINFSGDINVYAHSANAWITTLVVLSILLVLLIYVTNKIKVSYELIRSSLNSKTKELEQIKFKHGIMATIDELTGVYNRRQFIELSDKEFQRFKRHSNNFVLMTISIDDFKFIYDNYGSDAGDAFLKFLVHKINGYIRQTDVLARHDVDELSLLMLETTSDHAKDVANRFRSSLGIDFEYNEDTMKTSLSIGITNALDGDVSIHNIIKRVDMALKKAIEEGKDRVEVVDDPKEPL
jgi:diguanylate cyclase (GGDEF)-like protein